MEFLLKNQPAEAVRTVKIRALRFGFDIIPAAEVGVGRAVAALVKIAVERIPCPEFKAGMQSFKEIHGDSEESVPPVFMASRRQNLPSEAVMDGGVQKRAAFIRQVAVSQKQMSARIHLEVYEILRVLVPNGRDKELHAGIHIDISVVAIHFIAGRVFRTLHI